MADSAEVPLYEANSVRCPHVSLAPQWDAWEDVGSEEKASGFVCNSCGQFFTRPMGLAVRSRNSTRAALSSGSPLEVLKRNKAPQSPYSGTGLSHSFRSALTAAGLPAKSPSERPSDDLPLSGYSELVSFSPGPISWGGLTFENDGGGEPDVRNTTWSAIFGVRDQRLQGKKTAGINLHHGRRVPSRFMYSKGPSKPIWHGWDYKTGLLDNLNRNGKCCEPLRRHLIIEADSLECWWLLKVEAFTTSGALFHFFGLFTKMVVPSLAEWHTYEAAAAEILNTDLSNLHALGLRDFCQTCGEKLSEVEERFGTCNTCAAKPFASPHS